MRIAFDGTTLQRGPAGVPSHAEHLLRHLSAEGSQDEIVVISNRAIDLPIPWPRRVEIVVSPSPLPRIVWLQTVVPRLLRHLRADVGHFISGMGPVASPIPTVVTIHDVNVGLLPWRYPPGMLHKPLTDLAVRRADAIITTSESARREIVQRYGLEDVRVHVVHEPPAPSFGTEPLAAELDRVRERYGLADRFILCGPTLEPRKSLPALIDGFAQRRASGELPHQLVCAGPCGWLSQDIEDRIEHLRLEDVVTFTGHVPPEDLPALYALAEMFVLPSSCEDLGPVVEAMTCGTPVIVGQLADQIEVGDAMEQVERLDAQSLGAAMMRLAGSPQRRERLRALGLKRSQAFSWDRAARATHEVYEHAIRARVRRRTSMPSAYRAPTQ